MTDEDGRHDYYDLVGVPKGRPRKQLNIQLVENIV